MAICRPIGHYFDPESWAVVVSNVIAIAEQTTIWSQVKLLSTFT